MSTAVAKCYSYDLPNPVINKLLCVTMQVITKLIDLIAQLLLKYINSIFDSKEKMLPKLG